MGNEEEGWTYFSIDGRRRTEWYSRIPIIGEGVGGEGIISKERFNTMEEFEKYRKIYLASYTVDVRIETTKEEDNIMTETTKEKLEGGWYYHAYYNNCTELVRCALEAIGLDPGYSEPYRVFDYDLGGESLPATPINRVQNIVNNNSDKRTITISGAGAGLIKDPRD